jgi:hypothetical protein
LPQCVVRDVFGQKLGPQEVEQLVQARAIERVDGFRGRIAEALAVAWR